MRNKLMIFTFNIGFLNITYLFFVYFLSLLSFIINISLTTLTLSTSLVIFSSIIFLLYLYKLLNLLYFKSSFILFLFLILSIFFFLVPYFKDTYDTSWDGQGYHSSGIISLANKWNPIYQPIPNLDIPDGKIFVSGYPKALWIIQSNIYLVSGSINSAKISNVIIGLTAILLVTSLLIYMRINLFFSLALSVLAVIQTSFVMQLFSFMEDGFVFALFVCSLAFLVYFAKRFDRCSFIGYFLSSLLLVSSKFSSLPVVIISVCLFILILYIKVRNYTFHIDEFGFVLNNFHYTWKKFILIMLGLCIFTFISLWLPYISNIIHFSHPLYPSNLQDVKNSYADNNIPLNLKGSNTITLLFYGVFSKSQINSGGNNDSSENLAILKIPFTFTIDELYNSESIFNNRVGSAGPLFSGIFIFSLLMLILGLVLSNKKNKNKYYLCFLLIIVIFLSNLVNPAPNLIRYNGQLLLLPLIVSFFFLIYNPTFYTKFGVLFLVILQAANIILFTYPNIQGRISEFNQIRNELRAIKAFGKPVDIEVKNFYSHKVRLQEAGIVVDKIVDKCSKPQILSNSFGTTKICN